MNEQTINPPKDPKTDHSGSVLVIGDEAVDWFEIAVPPDEESAGDLPPNFRVTGGLRRAWAFGGASLLREMVDKAGATVIGPASRIPDPHKVKLQTVVRLRKYVEHVEKQPDRDVYRAEQLIGFVVESSRSSIKTGAASPSGTAAGDASTPAAVVLVDDSGNGFRRSELDPALAAVIKEAKLVVIRLSRPLAVRGHRSAAEPNTCLDGILESRLDARTIIVLNVDDLRREGLEISRRLSWERTAGDLAKARDKAFGKPDPDKQPGLALLADLINRADLIVRIGVEGAVFLPRDDNKTPILAFDPASVEHNRRGETGHMVGLRTCFIAALTAALAQAPADESPEQIEEALKAGLAAAARLFDLGCAVELPSAKPGTSAGKPTSFTVSYSYAKLFPDEPEDGSTSLPSFQTVEIKKNGGWSLLVDACNSKRLDPVKIVTEGTDELKDIPSAIYGKLRLVDIREIEAFRAIDNLFREYHQRNRINARDARPLSIAVFGQPGAGKSYGTKEVAKSALGDAMAQSEINLSQLQNPDQLNEVFFSFRNDSLVGKMPVVLFDECDAQFQNNPVGWLKYFLMPMQDGQFSHLGRTHSIGPAIFVFIGGTKPTFKDFAEQGEVEENKREEEPQVKDGKQQEEAQGKNEKREQKTDDQREKFIQAKLPDFVSRLRGHVDVQGPNRSSPEEDVAYQIRRAVILRSVLEREKVHCPSMFTGKRIHIDQVVVRAFLACEKYKHGTRSLEAIVGMSQLAGRDRFDLAALPSEKQLRMHVDSSFDRVLRGEADHRG